MTRPTTRQGTANIQFTKRVPADIKRILAELPSSYRPKGWGKEVITISTGTSDKRRGPAEVARIGAEVADRFARLRAGSRALSTKETVALAGTIYRAFADTLENNPGSVERWEKVISDNRLARSGQFGLGSLMIDPLARRSASMEDRFGPFVDAILARECLIIRDEDRDRLMTQIARALDEAAIKLKRNAGFDYSEDPAARRYPTWQPVTVDKPRKGIKLAVLFETWASHPEQSEQAKKTIARYRGVFHALEQFLKSPDASTITKADISRYTDAMMGEGKLRPRTVRDVHKAAISSVFNWSVGKGLVPTNPADGIRIKVRSSALLRPKELTDNEARDLTRLCLALPLDSPARSQAAARRWCPLVCLWTGARINEVTQLRKQDIHAKGGVVFIRITPEAGTVKTSEYRDVPVHPRLAEIGFLSFVATQDQGPLFVDPTRRRKADAETPLNERVGNDVASWAKKECLTDPLLKKPLHAIRHRFLTVARRAGIDQQYTTAITGHVAEGQDQKYGSYEIETLAREIGRLRPEVVEGGS